MGKLLELLEKLVRAIFGPGDKQDAEEVKPAPEPPEPPGAEAVTGWQGGPPYRFVDVSRYQGLIDWAQVAAAGYKGAMLKTVSTNRKLSKRADGLYIDPTFESNYRNAKAAGLDVGVYYYTYATSEAMADAELALLRQAVRGKELTLPVAVDVEENKLKPMSTLDLTNLTAYALEQVERMGFYAQLYTYTHYSNRTWAVWQTAGTSGCPIRPGAPPPSATATTPTSTPVKAAYRASPATWTSTSLLSTTRKSSARRA